MIRHPQFAGSWYPEERAGIMRYLVPGVVPRPALGAICPHAGWIYSGATAGAVYSRLPLADTYILIGPNHTGRGARASLFAAGSWQMPLGRVAVDADAAHQLMAESEFLEEDYAAHMGEHSLEIQLPFIQNAQPAARIVPIILMDADAEIAADIGRSVARVIRKSADRRMLIIASSDMSHYEHRRYAEQNDRLALDRICALDADGLLAVVERRGISMCGAGPVAALLIAARALGARTASVVRYATSGEQTGEEESVVGYAGVIVPAPGTGSP